MKIYYILLFVICFTYPVKAQSQENLHLVATITGTDEHNKIYGAKGIGDFNGDGYDDFIVALQGKDTMVGIHSYATTYINLYYGSPKFDTIPVYTFKNSIAYPIGDVTGDGYADLMVGQNDYSYIRPLTTFKIYRGGKTLDTIPIWTYTPPYYWDMEFSDDIETIGDLNGDGYRDFVISTPYNWDDGRGKVYIFHGGDIIAGLPAQILSYKFKKTGDSFFGYSVVGIGDINKDGYDDILISEQTLDEDSCNVQLYYGGKQLDSIPKKILMQKDPQFGINVKNAGDINNDGNKDFIISGDNVYIYLSLDDVKIIGADSWGIGGFISVGSGGDINGDGYNDFLIGNTNTRDSLRIMTGAVFGFWGGNNLDTIPTYQIIGHKKWNEFGKNISIVGDINKDGYDDVFIIEPSFSDYNHPVGKLYIFSYKSISSLNPYESINRIKSFELKQNYPNPFNPSTKFNYKIPVLSKVSITVYNLLGKIITVLINETKQPGEYEINFDADKYNLSSGTYFVEFNVSAINSSTNTKGMNSYIYHKVIKAVLLK